jgi:hypothetical protein
VLEEHVGVVAEDDVEAAHTLGEVNERTDSLAGSVVSRDAHVRDGDDDIRTGRLSLRLGVHRCRNRIGDLDRPEAAREDERRRLRVGDTDDGDLDTADIEHLPALDAAEVVFEVPEVGRNVLELRQVDHLLEMVGSPVKVVIAERIDVEAHQVHRLHGGLLVEEPRQRRGSTVGVACGQR